MILQQGQEEEIPHQDHADFEADEALSLRDLPLFGDGEDGDDDEKGRSRRRSDDPLREDPFEFSASSSYSNDHNNNSAEYMIFGGKLLPYSSSTIDDHHPFNNNNNDDNGVSIIKNNYQTIHRDLKSRGDFYHHRRSESVRDFYSSEHRLMIRPSRSLDYTKLHRSSSSAAAKSPTTQSDRRFSTASTTCFGNRRWSVSGRGASRPRWRLLMFGMIRAPARRWRSGT
ncbi:hypothetical protein Syun_024927 [Stephania yunnanensis]|uniref:Uncharacterized protein n=1 Tax=Stephania yunnanensis TaxID=152371 RepID=A0AAP0ETN8_9MAGN